MLYDSGKTPPSSCFFGVCYMIRNACVIDGVCVGVPFSACVPRWGSSQWICKARGGECVPGVSVCATATVTVTHRHGGGYATVTGLVCVDRGHRVCSRTSTDIVASAYLLDRFR